MAQNQNPKDLKKTKKSQLIQLLSRGEAINLDKLSKTLGWQRHTTSAAMTRLKQEGHNLVSEKIEGQARTYRIDVDPANTAGNQDAQAHQGGNPNTTEEAEAA